MKKLIAACLVLGSFSASAQTLFHYGKDSVSAQEFLRAYGKNNTGARTEQGMRDYLDLYVASRLKIAEARQRGYDTLPQLVADLENLRQQIIPGYLTDRETMNRILDEAFQRSQKDIHIAHIFIAARDAETAARKAAEAEAELKKGTPFATVAKKYSDDPAVGSNGGDLGFITLFTLPYELENLAYTTAPGEVSAAFRSKGGYHIFKNIEERKALGRIKASQILLAFPPGASEGEKTAIRKRADSLYNRLLKGDDFTKLAQQFSNDVISSANNGRLAEFGTGEYGPEFEKAAFALAKDGAISAPFLTAHGYHILRRESRIPVATAKSEKVMEELREKVEQNDRIAFLKSQLAQKILKESTFKKLFQNDAELWSYSDSVLNGQHSPSHVHFSGSTPLFALNNKQVTSSDWIGYAQTFRFRSDGNGTKNYAALWNEFVEATAIEYYQRNLENYNADFRQQLQEFRDGNLFFEIMQRDIWGPAQSDSNALAAYFKKHQAKYNWKQSADAVIFYASDEASARTLALKLKAAPANWKALVEEMSATVAADSARFETESLPNPTKLALKEGLITQPLVNKADNSASFALVLRYYPQPAPRTFADARGLVITDYQEELEKAWVAELRKKYLVKVNEAEWKKVVANTK